MMCKQATVDIPSFVSWHLLLDSSLLFPPQVRHLFQEPPEAYSKGTLEPLDGITFPVRNTTDPEFQASVGAINIYLNHLPALVRTVIPNPSKILNNINAFAINFQALAKKLSWNTSTDLQRCCSNSTKLKDYRKKELILRIVYFCRKWTETFFEQLNNHTSPH